MAGVLRQGRAGLRSPPVPPVVRAGGAGGDRPARPAEARLQGRHAGVRRGAVRRAGAGCLRATTASFR